MDRRGLAKRSWLVPWHTTPIVPLFESVEPNWCKSTLGKGLGWCENSLSWHEKLLPRSFLWMRYVRNQIGEKRLRLDHVFVVSVSHSSNLFSITRLTLSDKPVAEEVAVGVIRKSSVPCWSCSISC